MSNSSDAPQPGGLPRIAVIDAALRENGGIRVMVDLAGRWHRAGAPTELFVMQKVANEGPSLATWAAEQVPVVYGSPTPGRLRHALGKVFARFLAAARRADVIVSVSEIGHGLLLGAAAAKLLRKPFVVVVHTPVSKAIEEWTPRPLHGVTLAAHRGADALVCVAQGCVDNLLSNGVPASRIHVIRNGIDVDRIQRNGRMAIEPPLTAEVVRPLVVSVGRLTPQKGFDLLLRAHAQVLAAGRTHHLAIIGEGPERPALEGLVSELGLSRSVTFLGFRQNPHAIMARADLFCMSSRYEGYPLALVEALALGVPIVSTNCVSGPSEVLADGEYGDLVEPGSVDALASGIERHLRDPQRLAALAQHGPTRARGFDPDRAAAEYLKVFAGVLS